MPRQPAPESAAYRAARDEFISATENLHRAEEAKKPQKELAVARAVAWMARYKMDGCKAADEYAAAEAEHRAALAELVKP